MNKELDRIARDVLGLETRRSDHLDFYDLVGMGDSQRLVDRVARLNPAAGEIGAGMLASLVGDAHNIQEAAK